MKSRVKYLKELKDQKYCPLPHGILFCPRIKILGDTRVKYFIDRFMQAHARSINTSEGNYVFEVFEQGEFYKVYHSKKFKAKIIREGVRLGLIKNLVKVNPDFWLAEFNLAYVFRDNHDRYE